MGEATSSIRMGKFRWVLAGIGSGAGATIAIAAIQAARYRPEFVPQLLNGGFLFFAALIFAMVLIDRKAERFLSVQGRTVLAQELLAENLGGLAVKMVLRDEAAEQRARELEITINHLARQSDEILRRVATGTGASS